MSESNLGKGTKKIYCQTNNKVYDSLTQAALELDIPIPYITRVAKGQRNHTKGYVFKYE